VIAQRSFFASYLGQTLAPALLLAGFCAAKALPELARVAEGARLVLVAAPSLATAFSAAEIDLFKRQDLPALTAAAEAIRASRPEPEDKLYVVNRSVWLNSMVDLAPPTKYFFPFQTLCAFTDAGPRAVAEILAARPRYIVIADRRTKYYPTSPRWRLVSASNCAVVACRAILKRQCALSMGVALGRRPLQGWGMSSFRSSRRISPVSWSERMTIERFTPSIGATAAATPRSAAECRRTDSLGWRPPPSETRHSDRGSRPSRRS
jgi:hypothetical protein